MLLHYFGVPDEVGFYLGWYFLVSAALLWKMFPPNNWANLKPWWSFRALAWSIGLSLAWPVTLILVVVVGGPTILAQSLRGKPAA